MIFNTDPPHTPWAISPLMPSKLDGYYNLVAVVKSNEMVLFSLNWFLVHSAAAFKYEAAVS